MKRISITLFAFALVAVTGRADPIIYFGEDLNPGNTLPSGGSAEVARNDFLSSISEVGTETMEGFSARTTAPLSLIFVGSNGPTSANLTGTFTRPPFDAVWDSPFDGRFAISGTQYWQTSDAFELVLSDPVSAFGFFATDGGDGPGQLTLRLGISGGGETDVVVPHTVSESANGAVMFFGFTDLTATYSSISFLNSDAGHDFFGFDDWTIGTVAAVPEPVTIDIKPGSDSNSIDPTSKGKIPVAILTAGAFDATQVDVSTVAFGPAGASESHGRGHVKDVDGDGDMDLVLHFNSQETGIQCGDTEATLTGETWAGGPIVGTDAITMVNCP